jgi:hypothetical protein
MAPWTVATPPAVATAFWGVLGHGDGDLGHGDQTPG